MKDINSVVMTEDQEQTALFKWLDAKGILAFAIPNGGHRDLVTATIMKRTGTKRGVPDIFIPIPTKRAHGLFIEMKRKDGGVVSKHQQEWIEKLIDNGYDAVVCKGADEAIKTIELYLEEQF